jgi:branched-chain amino acid transport system substrate-binding protein
MTRASLHRRAVLMGGSAATVSAPALVRRACAEQAPGVTDFEIRFGNSFPYSGPISSYATIARTEVAYFRMINEQGGHQWAQTQLHLIR